MVRADPNEEARKAAAALPRHFWIIAQAPQARPVERPGGGVDWEPEPYPCLCHTRRGKTCSAAWCPCSGRPDPQGPSCCAMRNGPAQHIEAMTQWRIKKLQEQEAEDLLD